MKVVLMHAVDNLGEAGEVVEVADGYARNYLIPRGLAERATPENIAGWEQEKARREKQAARAREEARKLAEVLEGAEVDLVARAGESGKLFGSITAANIADALQDKLGARIDRRTIDLSEPLRELGEHEVRFALYEDIDAFVKVKITAEA